MSFGVYVHVPYCASVCAYCDFNSVAVAAPPWERYAASVRGELAARVPAFAGLTARSLYFGGGTPSLAPVACIASIVAAVREQLPLAGAAETTLEANPGTVDVDQLAALRAIGVNRLSIGWQSTHDHLLALLGRGHDAAQGREAVATARRAGFDNLSVDLIFAVPGQTRADLERDLDAVLELAVEHVSLYALTFHADTELWRRREEGRLPPIDEDLEADMMDLIEASLTGAGYEHYEVSNYARPGRRAIHNTLYWTGGQYLGLGPGAHSFCHDDWRRGRRWEGRREPEAYYAAWRRGGRGGCPRRRGAAIEMVEALTRRQLMSERFMCGLRFADGLDLREPVFTGAMAGIAPGLEAAERRGWLTREGTRIRPTVLGMRFADALAGLFF